MRLGFCSIVERGSVGQVLDRLVLGLGEIGVELRNPVTGLVTELVGVGEQVVTSREALVDQACSEEGATFQLWFAGDTDVDCWLLRLAGGLVRHNYSLDGFTPHEREAVVSWAVGHFRRACREGAAVLCVIDQLGTTADVDWDGAAVGHPLPSRIPELLGVSAERLSELSLGSEASVERLGRMVLISARV